MSVEIEFTDEFETWWNTLTEAEQISIDAVIRILEEKGSLLGRPFVDTLKGSRLPNLKELRVQHAGKPYRILFAFDPRRVALLLIGGNKTGNNRWYEVSIPFAEALYQGHLNALEGSDDGT
ncbi:MAG: type II toxin-antitoxin system RelE/ParE family toxin [Terriglobus sp.]